VAEIARKILDLTSSASSIVFQSLPEDDPKVRRPDITRAWQLLGWSPRISLEEGLQRTITYFRTRVAAAKGVRIG
jgi:nucleoside-diphosphate-sugar epimerase